MGGESYIPLTHVMAGSTRGAAHKRDGTCCQDSVSVKEGYVRGKPYLVCSVADGHGGSAHSRSDVGSALATLAGEQTAMQFMLQLGEESAGEEGRNFEQSFRTLLQRRWIDNIKQLLDQFYIDADTVTKYGSTLLTVLVYDEMVYVAQLGDGDIFYVERSGESGFLIEPEFGPVSSVTTSLCNAGAGRNIHCFSIPCEQVEFMMMSSDGLMNSLAGPEHFARFHSFLNEYLKVNRPADVRKLLPTWLSDCSVNGNGDDISLIVIQFPNIRNAKGEQDESVTPGSRSASCQKVGRGRAGRRLFGRTRGKKIRAQAVQGGLRHVRAEKYYQLSRSGRAARR